MKKKYESPRAVADLFYPEESISSCYNIACEYGIMGGEKGIHAPNAFTLDGVTIPGDLGAYRIGSLKRELPCGSKSKLHQFQDYNLGGEKCLEKLMFFIYCWLYICIICYILAAKNKKEGVVYD